MTTKRLFPVSVLLLGCGVLLLGLGLMLTAQPARAFPEYAMRTGETCGTCHFNPAGGGPRTPRGELWVIEGRNETVPQLPGEDRDGADAASAELEVVIVDFPVLEEVTEADLEAGKQYFELLTCNNCHGDIGEGTSAAPALYLTVIDADTIASTVRSGPDVMPAIPENIVPDAQLAQIIAYVQDLAIHRPVPVEVLDAPGLIGMTAPSGGES